METSSSAWTDASFDQYHFHIIGDFEFDRGFVMQDLPSLLIPQKIPTFGLGGGVAGLVSFATFT